MPTGLWQRMRSRDGDSDDGESGSAVVEFVFLGALLLVPLVYLIILAAQVQGAAYAVAGAADQAAKVYAAAGPDRSAEEQARKAAELVLSDFGFNDPRLDLAVLCSGECHAPGSAVTVTVAFDVPLPVIAAVPGLDFAPVRVDATSMQTVERFR